MSLILEALRKSEAERRRGQTPDPFAEITVSPRVHRAATPTWIWICLTALVLLVLAWLARDWWLSGNASATDAPRVARQSKSDDALNAATQAAARTVRDSAAPAPSSTQGTQPSTALAAAPKSTVAAPPASATPSPAPTQPSEAKTSLQPDPESTASVAPVSSAVPTATPPATAPASEESVALSELSAAERKQLPPLKVSMHIYAAAPSGRFVIIDGTRLAEGESIGGALIDQITADGVVISWNGRRVRVPLR